MSAKTMGQVWDLALPQNELLVLLALADHADHEGRNMFPGVALLAWKTGYSERTVIRLLNKLVQRNVLIRRHRPGLATVYDANLDAAPKKADRPVKKPKTRKAKTHDKAMSYDAAMSLVTSSPVQKTATHDMPSRKVSDEPSIKQPSSGDDVLTERQKVIRLLARWHEAKTGQTVSPNVYTDMQLLADDFTLAQVEQAVLSVGDRQPQKPMAYLRRILADGALKAELKPALAPAVGGAFWGRDLTDGD